MNPYIFLNILIPVIIGILIPDGRYGYLFVIVDYIILPASLLIMNVLFVHNKVCPSFTIACLFMMVGLLLNNLVGYSIWGMSSGRFFNPDGETIYIFQGLVKFSVGFSVICLILGLVFTRVFSLFSRPH